MNDAMLHEKEPIKPRKVFDVLVNKFTYGVYSIEGKEHHSEPVHTWWVYFTRKPFDENDIDEDAWLPYTDTILRPVWTIKVTQSNFSKFKWDHTSFRNHIYVEMYANDKLVYEFTTSGNRLDYAFAKVQYLQVQMQEHVYNFFDPESEVGRKIYWKGLPATILTGYEPGNIRIKPDYTTGLSKVEWWIELAKKEKQLTKVNDPDDDDYIMDIEDREEEYQIGIINWGSALQDQFIDWFRK